MVQATDLVRAAFSRVWLIKNRAGPANVPRYEGLARGGEVDWPQGDPSITYVPDPNRYGQFLVAGRTLGERGSPNLPIISRYQLDAQSIWLQITRGGCDHDVQIHMGNCQDPQLFNEGWDKILVLEGAVPTNWGTGALGALSPEERSLVDETIPLSGLDLYEIVKVTYAQEAAAEIVQEVIDVVVCDQQTCGECGIASDGCDIVFALTLSAGGSPGLSAEVVFTQDGGDTYSDTNITTLAANEDPNAFACVGVNLVVISEDSDSLHYAPIADILTGTEVWTEMATGFVVGQGPLAMVSLGPRHTWIVGEGGYVYFTEDPTASVSVQDAGIATTEDLQAIHGFNTRNLVAVGNNNAVIVSQNGGATWAAITGPSVGVVLNTVWMRSETEWFIGDAGGQLWYTQDSGTTWTEKAFPGSGAGVIRDIAFSSPTVGYMSHDTAAPAGRILRTINGGQSWFVSPLGNTNIPANDRLNAIAVCEENVNELWAGGLEDGAVDGILVHGEGAFS